MGRKINPLIFRSKYKYKKSNWVGTNESYSRFLSEDFSLRKFISKFFDKEKIDINSIFIFRKQTSILANKIALYIVIYLSKIKSKKAFKKVVHLKNLLKREFRGFESKINVRIMNADEKQLIVEKFINLTTKIKQNGSIKLLVSNFISSLKKLNELLGVKIIVSGRIHGSEKARTLKDKFGLINLQKINSKICFLNKTINTKDGLINLNFIYNLK